MRELLEWKNGENGEGREVSERDFGIREGVVSVLLVRKGGRPCLFKEK